jgi:hypothetical protein
MNSSNATTTPTTPVDRVILEAPFDLTTIVQAFTQLLFNTEQRVVGLDSSLLISNSSRSIYILMIVIIFGLLILVLFFIFVITFKFFLYKKNVYKMAPIYMNSENNHLTSF